MIPGPEWIIACPHCQAPARRLSLVSGNTLGARVWTDGRMLAPMLPDHPSITRCRTCQGFFRVEEAEKLEDLEPFATDAGPDAPWLETPLVQPLRARDLIEAATGGLPCDHDQERELRLLAWWADNDQRRDMDDKDRAPGPMLDADTAVENMQRLSTLLDANDPNQRIMQAELARELGSFADAAELLERAPADHAVAVADFIRDLVRSDVAELREIPARLLR